MSKDKPSPGLPHKIPPIGPQIGKQQGIRGIPVAEGENWQDLSREQREQYFRNLENRSKQSNTNSSGNSETYSRG